ncbi:MAG TPA: DUF29 domain-containing protein [Stellaceae bacterium]|nr:DUF29 domain-containing protein [Stellaceae bacterium]
MSDVTSLYDEDFFLWSKAQADALRSAARGATNQPIDWDNLAEEIESLGRSDKRELSSQIRRVIEHLLKLEHSRATDPRPGWIDSIVDARNQIEVVLDDSPSLRHQIEAILVAEHKRAARKAISDLGKYRESDQASQVRINAAAYTADQVLADWFPPEPRPDGE